MDFILQNVGWIAVWIASGILLLWPELQSNLGNVSGISTLEATQLINQRHALVVDLRRPEDFAAGHIPGARHFAADELDRRGEEIARFKSRPVILVATGKNPSAAIKTLKAQGFEQVVVLRGGLSAWVEASLPVEKSTAGS